MEFIHSLKTTARQIIELSKQLADRAHTWSQEKSALGAGYTDRAGFIVYDDIELFADVYAAEDGSECLLRARLALSPKEEDQTLFTIITLDFYCKPEKVKAIVAVPDRLTQQDLVSLLQDVSTTPKLIHVSLESGKDDKGKNTGKRYEYTSKQLEKLTEADKKEFISTINKAFEQISRKV